MMQASRRSEVAPFHAMDVLAQANRLRAAGASVISLAVGQPSDPAPVGVREAAKRALQDGRIGYTDALGVASLREAIAQHYLEHYGVQVPVDRVVITTGSSAAFNLAFLAMFDAGDRVAITSPGYPAYRNIMATLGLEVVEIDLEGDAFLSAARLRAASAEKPLKGLLFASPANPTGASIPQADLIELLAEAKEQSISVISDEIYHRLNHTGPDQTALSVNDDVVIINSFSKYYCMTGWRIGWMILPKSLVRPVECIQQSLYISPPELSQIAACEAFNATAELEAVKARYQVNRELLLHRLPGMGLRLAAPMDGAFYAWCDVSSLTNDSMDFVRRVLAETHVAITPGCDFDVGQGHRFVRLSYAGGCDEIADALNRMEKWLRKT